VRRVLPIAAAVVVLGFAVGVAAQFAFGDPQHAPCGGPGFANGSDPSDGAFAAVVRRGCADDDAKRCTVADATSAINTEVVPQDVRLDCHAFNQFVGSGLNGVPGYVTGECFGRARVESVDGTRVAHPRFRCRE
jgi:hypothetical protein